MLAPGNGPDVGTVPDVGVELGAGLTPGDAIAPGDGLAPGVEVDTDVGWGLGVDGERLPVGEYEDGPVAYVEAGSNAEDGERNPVVMSQRDSSGSRKKVRRVRSLRCARVFRRREPRAIRRSVAVASIRSIPRG